MKPQMMKCRHGNGEYGDCLRACVATMLDMEPEDVPHFSWDGSEAWSDRLNEWLDERELGYFFMEIKFAEFRDSLKGWFPKNSACYFMIGVPSAIPEDIGHWAIGMWDGHTLTPVHDPSRIALEYTEDDIETVGFFIWRGL